MLGFGLTSAVMCVAKTWFERHWRLTSTIALYAFGPLAVASNLTAQQIPFNAIFLVSDPNQKWRLFANFLLYLLPFLAGATFLGTVFLRAKRPGSTGSISPISPAPACAGSWSSPPCTCSGRRISSWRRWCCGGIGSLLWFAGLGASPSGLAFVLVAGLTVAAHFAAPPMFGLTKLAVSDYKGVSYARRFPDSRRVYARDTPFGFIEVYASSYLHFAPGLSDNAAFNLKTMPGADAYLGLYVDGEGPAGIIRDLPQAETDYFRYLPMIYPFVIKKQPSTFVVQFGGGLSTSVALHNRGTSPSRRAIRRSLPPSARIRRSGPSPATSCASRPSTWSTMKAGSTSPTPETATTSST